MQSVSLCTFEQIRFAKFHGGLSEKNGTNHFLLDKRALILWCPKYWLWLVKNAKRCKVCLYLTI